MGKYTVEVEMRYTEVWYVEANSAKEAEAKWSAGEATWMRSTDGEAYDTHVTEGQDDE